MLRTVGLRLARSPWVEALLLAVLSCVVFFSYIHSVGAVELPGEDATDKLEMVGTIMETADTIFFTWVSFFLAGGALMFSAWGFINSRPMSALMGFLGAIIFVAVPQIVRNLSDWNEGGIFGSNETRIERSISDYDEAGRSSRA